MPEDVPSKIAAMRRDYRVGSLTRADLEDSPIHQFAKWFYQAEISEIREPNAMTLSTIGLDGAPTSRTVLMKDFDDSGVTFFTNYTSRKAQEIASQPAVSLLFFWKELERQVHVRGKASKISREESEAYFFARPYDARIGAWASRQSSTIPDRGWLTDRINSYRDRFPETEAKDCVPLPDFWGGYLIEPQSVEFWQGQPGRNHDRFVYSRTEQGSGWNLDRWSP